MQSIISTNILHFFYKKNLKKHRFNKKNSFVQIIILELYLIILELYLVIIYTKFACDYTQI
jgi:hypothetical protein